MVHRLFAVAAWASLAFIAYATLTRVDFVYAIYFKLSPILEHPAVRKYAFFEHFIAFCVFWGGSFLCLPKTADFRLLCCFLQRRSSGGYADVDARSTREIWNDRLTLTETKMLDRDTKELLIGFGVALIFAIALIYFQQ
jgi:hypothetical protein